ncbi:response regulator [Marinilabiliaceae bacterium JC017]|nr:response regulator [Marinilabiliaceae bacterium JC017]
MTDLTPYILLVDDSPVNIDILKDSLSRYKCLSATNGQEALKLALSSTKPDLILLDVIMPGMDGYEVCRRLKREPTTQEVPIIFITGQNDPQSILKGFEAGAIDYITKPFNIPELKARVKTQITIKMARDQNQRLIHKIEAINKKLTDSIEYAKKIQAASLPKPEYLNQVMPEHFVFYKPRDIVSGDFFWVRELDSKLIIIAADCTGHGVPGAIMSMFGVAYLNEIVGKENVTKPSEILNQLRTSVIESLNQDEDSEVKDGMDISVVTLNMKNQQVEFAGAFNSMLHIRDNQLTVYPADHMPVSYGLKDRSFTNHIIPIQNNDCLYLFTDGFADQFGGEMGKKLMQKGFKHLILQNHHLPMQEQKRIYTSFFENWKGTQEQVDDVLLIGVRL